MGRKKVSSDQEVEDLGAMDGGRVVIVFTVELVSEEWSCLWLNCTLGVFAACFMYTVLQ